MPGDEGLPAGPDALLVGDLADVVALIEEGEMHITLALGARDVGDPVAAQRYFSRALRFYRMGGRLARQLYDTAHGTAPQPAAPLRSENPEERSSPGAAAEADVLFLPLEGGPWDGWMAGCHTPTNLIWLARVGRELLAREGDPSGIPDLPPGGEVLGFYAPANGAEAMVWTPVLPRVIDSPVS